MHDDVAFQPDVESDAGTYTEVEGSAEKRMTYRWDVFLSYPRTASVDGWVHTHFLPALREALTHQLPHDPEIFVDTSQPTGVVWPVHLREALLCSRLLVAVWTPPYFRSPWCTAEWKSMLAREDVLKADGVSLERGLVYPVVFSDGHHFDERAKSTQYRRDLSKFNYSTAVFRESQAFLDFSDVMKSVAEEIEEHLSLIPPWQDGWPIHLPVMPPPSPVKLVQL